MKGLRNILFWGATWGILEATIGWGLHLVHFKGEALVLYPFGLMCMLAAMRQCDDKVAVTLKVAAVASLIKLVNLITWPGVPLYYVVNPAIAIFLEGLVTYAFCYYAEKKRKRNIYSLENICIVVMLVMTSFLLFKGWQVAMDRWTDYNPMAHLILSGDMLLTWLWKSALQGLMLLFSVWIAYRWTPDNNWNLQTTRWALPMLVVAVVATFCL